MVDVDANVVASNTDLNQFVDGQSFLPDVPELPFGFQVPELSTGIGSLDGFLAAMTSAEWGLVFVAVLLLLWTFKGKSVLMILQIAIVFFVALVLFNVLQF